MKQLLQTETLEEIIKKSTFIAIVSPVSSVQQAQDFLQQHSNLTATHNCWAYQIGQEYRFNDDGEPSGTAGKPILNAITGQEFDNTVALVIRHYGGIKLGTGGLMRAYGGVVSRCLQQADFEPIKHYSEFSLSVPFALTQSIYNLVRNFDAEINSESYNNSGAELNIRILNEELESFKTQAVNLCKGDINFLVEN